MSTAKKFAGQTAVYGLTTIAPRILNFFLTPVYVKAYPAKVYGVFTTMFSWVSMINPILAFGMETTFFRYLNKRPDEKQQVYNNTFGAILAISFLFLLSVLPFIGDIAAYVRIDEQSPLDDYKQYVGYFIAVLLLDAWCVIPFAQIRANGRPGRYGIIKCTNILVFILLNLLFIYGLPFLIKHDISAEWLKTWFRPGWIGYVFLSNLIASALTLLLLLPEIMRLRPNFDKAMFSEMLLYSWPVLIANLSFVINENLDKLLLGKFLPESISASQTGIYGACAKIAVFLNIFVQAFRLGAEPFFFSKAKDKNAGTTYAFIMDYFVIAVSLIFVALVANIDILKYFIKGRDAVQQELYWSGLKAVPLLLLGYVSLGIYMNLSVWYKLSDQTRYGLYISGVGAIITVVLNVVFIPKYSYMASAWASLAAYASMMILSYVWGQKNYPIPYNVKKNLAYLISSIIIVFLSFSVFKRNLFIGNGLLVLFAGTAFMAERKQVLAILKRK
ncbi:polysaccharide biosynthesis C-terminal domain-containing protein [Mucilaginibacter terrae]|uniref:O-antigen/teichoic acid export membrane protein n=1 Tax=Mucilaginibacter terrae TaxID=1955052 RepID=A0ABU3GXJ5_9SPHI|nr:polysaccharide biosynthesis C-terminal domain-containing protein [Mucilaginibacter terrae]MDT3404488.1 O-antigen/teichoic acid export membrane protein [Mucilaginibacter terrae]